MAPRLAPTTITYGFAFFEVVNGKHLVVDVAIVKLVHPAPVSGRNRVVAPVLVVGLVQTKQLYPALLDMILQYEMHPSIGPFGVGTHAGREGQHPGPSWPMTWRCISRSSTGENQWWCSWFTGRSRKGKGKRASRSSSPSHSERENLLQTRNSSIPRTRPLRLSFPFSPFFPFPRYLSPPSLPFSPFLFPTLSPHFSPTCRSPLPSLMPTTPTRFVFGLHLHQPVGNFDSVFEEHLR